MTLITMTHFSQRHITICALSIMALASSSCSMEEYGSSLMVFDSPGIHVDQEGNPSVSLAQIDYVTAEVFERPLYRPEDFAERDITPSDEEVMQWGRNLERMSNFASNVFPNAAQNQRLVHRGVKFTAYQNGEPVELTIPRFDSSGRPLETSAQDRAAAYVGGTQWLGDGDVSHDPQRYELELTRHATYIDPVTLRPGANSASGSTAIKLTPEQATTVLERDLARKVNQKETYDLATNNCQHTTAEILADIKATRSASLPSVANTSSSQAEIVQETSQLPRPSQEDPTLRQDHET